jgi:hypothetical protein
MDIKDTEEYKSTKNLLNKITMKQETIEEAAEDNAKKVGHYAGYQDFIAGAEWQAEQDKNKYSDEDIINALHSVELKNNKNYSKIYEGMKEYLHSLNKQD